MINAKLTNDALISGLEVILEEIIKGKYDRLPLTECLIQDGP